MEKGYIKELAKDSFFDLCAEFSHPGGLAFIGELPVDIRLQMAGHFAANLGGTLVKRFPLQFIKSNDSKKVLVSSPLYIFTEGQLAAFVDNVLNQRNKQQADLLSMVPEGEG